jgi:hypothetical protein
VANLPMRIMAVRLLWPSTSLSWPITTCKLHRRCGPQTEKCSNSNNARRLRNRDNGKRISRRLSRNAKQLRNRDNARQIHNPRSERGTSLHRSARPRHNISDARRLRNRNANQCHSLSAKPLPNAKQHRNLNAKQLRNAKRLQNRNVKQPHSHNAKLPRNHNANQRHSLKNARQLRNVKRRHNVRQLRSRNSTLRLRKTKTSTRISCVRRGIRGNIRGCPVNPRPLATLPVNNRGKSAPTQPATNCAKPCLLIQGR